MHSCDARIHCLVLHCAPVISLLFRHLNDAKRKAGGDCFIAGENLRRRQGPCEGLGYLHANAGGFSGLMLRVRARRLRHKEEQFYSFVSPYTSRGLPQTNHAVWRRNLNQNMDGHATFWLKCQGAMSCEWPRGRSETLDLLMPIRKLRSCRRYRIHRWPPDMPEPNLDRLVQRAKKFAWDPGRSSFEEFWPCPFTSMFLTCCPNPGWNTRTSLIPKGLAYYILLGMLT